MQKVRLFAECFKTQYNFRVWINPNFKLDFFSKVVTNLFKTTSAGELLIKLFPARESLVSDIPAGDGKTDSLFFTVYTFNPYEQQHGTTTSHHICTTAFVYEKVRINQGSYTYNTVICTENTLFVVEIRCFLPLINTVQSCAENSANSKIFCYTFGRLLVSQGELFCVSQFGPP